MKLYQGQSLTEQVYSATGWGADEIIRISGQEYVVVEGFWGEELGVWNANVALRPVGERAASATKELASQEATAALCPVLMDKRAGAGWWVDDNVLLNRMDIQILDPQTGLGIHRRAVPVHINIEEGCVTQTRTGEFTPIYPGDVQPWTYQGILVRAMEDPTGLSNTGDINIPVATFSVPRRSELRIADFDFMQACEALLADEHWGPYGDWSDEIGDVVVFKRGIMVTALARDDDDKLERDTKLFLVENQKTCVDPETLEAEDDTQAPVEEEA